MLSRVYLALAMAILFNNAPTHQVLPSYVYSLRSYRVDIQMNRDSGENIHRTLLCYASGKTDYIYTNQPSYKLNWLCRRWIRCQVRQSPVLFSNEQHHMLSSSRTLHHTGLQMWNQQAASLTEQGNRLAGNFVLIIWGYLWLEALRLGLRFGEVSHFRPFWGYSWGIY